MALTKKVAVPGNFEDSDADTAVATAPAQAPAAKPEVVAKTAIAKAQGTGMAMFSGIRPGALFKDLKTDGPPYAFNTFPRFSGSQGVLTTQDGKQVLGDSCVIELMSFNDLYMVSPGEKSKESTEYVKYSNDGVTINETGESLAEYLAELRQDFPKAAKKQYTSLWGVVLKVGAKSNCKDSILGKIVEISLAPTSRPSLTAAESQLQLDIRRGHARLDLANILTVTCEAAVSQGNQYTKLVVSGTPDDEAEALVSVFAAPVSE
jgi:hypothetical protein